MTIKLVCPECRRENEPERIYCHDCGARLDRTALSKLKPTTEDPKATRRRLQIMLDPQRAKMRHMFFKSSKVILWALVVAAVIQMVLPPDVPPVAKGLVMPTQINLDLESAAENPGAAPLRYSDQAVSDYLGKTLKNKELALAKFLKFERVIAVFDEGVCRITIARSVAGFPIFTTTSYSVTLQDGTVTAVNRGGRLGRLYIHAAIMKYLDIIFADVWQVLSRDRKALAKMAAIEFHPQEVIITPPAAAGAQPAAQSAPEPELPEPQPTQAAQQPQPPPR